MIRVAYFYLYRVMNDYNRLLTVCCSIRDSLLNVIVHESELVRLLSLFLSFSFRVVHAPFACQQASQAGPMCNPRDGTSVVLRNTIKLT